MDKQKKLSKIIKLDQKKVKKIQKRKAGEKQKQDRINKIKEFKFTKKHLVVLIIIIVGILAYILIQNYHLYGIGVKKDITSDDATIIETMYADSTIYPYGEHLLLFEREQLKEYDYKGNLNWTKKLEGIFTPDVYVSGKYIQITNNDTGYIYILNGQYECGRIKIDGKILSASINESGTSIVEYSTSGLKTVISIFNNSGNELYGLKLDNNTISSYCLSDDLKYLAYAYADISGVSLITKIDIINLEDLKIDEYTVNTIGNKNNQLVYKMYWEGQMLNILLGDEIICYNAKTKETVEYGMDNVNILDIDIFSDKLAYISTGGKNSAYTLNINTFAGKQLGQAEVIDLPKYFIYSNNLIYVCLQNEINIFNKWGWNIKNYKSDVTVTKPIIFNNGKCIGNKVSNRIIVFKI